MSNTWLVYFDSDGFECIMNVSQIMRDNMVKKLSGEPQQSIPLQQMELRARFNTQRCPEIWTFTATEDIDQQALDQWADEAPQQFADWVRANGTSIGNNKPYVKNKNRIV